MTAKETGRSWGELTPEERLKRRIDAWLAAPGLEFASAQAEEEYKARINNFLDAVTLRKTPHHVPVMPNLGSFVQRQYGYTEKDMIYDPDKVSDASIRATLEFQIDMQVSTTTTLNGPVSDILNYKQYNWPGHGVPDDGEFQFIEDEYLKADEYDALMRDPTDFWWRTILPRVAGALEGFKQISLPTFRLPNAADYARPEVQAALRNLMAAGQEAARFQQKAAAASKKLKELGYPTVDGGTSLVPFDFLGDALRGTRGISYDMFRQPEKLMQALEWAVPVMIQRGIASARMGNAPIVGFAMHKGSDPYMSDEHFKKFYWEPWRKVMEGLIDEGLIIRGGCQGFHNKRLETYRTMPKGWVYWNIGYGTDIARAKELLDGLACISGGITAGVLQQGTPEEVAKHSRQAIEIAARGGGYIFATSNIDRSARLENVKAMISTAKEYGLYA
jgi:hypothetical protein